MSTGPDYDALLSGDTTDHANEYDALLGKPQQVAVVAGHDAAVRSALGQQVDPARYAEAVKLSRETGLPVDVVHRNLDDVRRVTTTDATAPGGTLDPEALRARAPRLSAYIAVNHDTTAPLLRVDVERLAAIEQASAAPVEKVGALSWLLGNEQFWKGGFWPLLAGDTTDARWPGPVEALLAGAANLEAGYVRTMAKYGLAPQSAIDWAAGRQQAADEARARFEQGGIIRSTTGRTLNVLPMVGGFAVGAMYGGPAGAVSFGAATGTGDRVAAYERLQGPNGERLDPTVARVLGTADSLVANVVMSGGMAKLMRGTEVVGAVEQAGVQAAQNATFTAAVKDAAARFGENYAGALWTMAKVAAVESVGEEITRGSLGNTPDPQRVAQRVTDAIVDAAKTFPIISAVGPARGLAGDALRLARERGSDAVVARMHDTARDLEVSKLDPTTAQDVLDELSFGEAPVFYWRTQSFVDYWTAKGQDPRAVASELTGDANALDRALSLGADLPVPAAAYMARVAPEPDSAKVLPDLKTAEDIAAPNERQPSPHDGDRVSESTPTVGTDSADTTRAQQAITTAARRLAVDAESPVTAYMSPEEVTAYRAARERAAAAAVEQVTRGLVSVRSAAARREYAGVLDTVRAQVEAELNARPEYDALRLMTRGEMPTGAKGERLPLNRAQVEAMIGTDAVEQLPKSVPPLLVREGGAHPDEVAALLGFDSGRDMLRRLVGLEPRGQAAERMVRERMDEQYGTRQTAQDIARAAEAALHEHGTDVLLAELRALERRTGREETPAAILANKARDAMAGEPVTGLRADVYARREVKAARELEGALARGDAEGALAAKEAQVLNHFLYREAQRAREERDGAVRYLESMSRDAARMRIGHAGGGTGEQVDALLERFGFRQRQLDRVGRRSTLENWIRAAEEEAFFPDVADWIRDETVRRNWKTLSLGELRDVRDAVKQLEHFATERNRVLTQDGKRDFAEVKIGLVAAAEQNTRDRGPIPTSFDLQSARRRIGRRLQQADAGMLRTETVLDWLDGGRIDGPWHKLFMNVAAEAQHREMTLLKDIAIRFGEHVRALPKEIRARLSDPAHVEDILRGSLINGDLSVAERLAFAFNTGNAGNWQRLRDGWQLTDEQIQRVLDTMSPEEARFIQDGWNLLEGLREPLAALERSTKGIEPEWVQAVPVRIGGVELDGGYFPLRFDPRFSSAGEKQVTGDLSALFPAGYVHASTPKGHTKARLDRVVAPPLLSLDVMPYHVASVVHDIAWREPIVSMARVLRDREIVDTLQRHLGEGRASMLMDWVKDLSTARIVSGPMADGVRFWSDTITALRANAVAVAYGLKATAILPNLLDVANVAEITGSKHVAAALWDYMRAPIETAQQAKVLSLELAHAFDTTNRDLRDGLQRLYGRTDARAQFQRFCFYGMEIIDVFTKYVAWKAAYRHGEELGYTGTDLRNYADATMRKTLHSSAVKDLPSTLRSRNEFLRLMTTSYSWFNQRFNRERDIGHAAVDAYAETGVRGLAGAFPKLMARAFFAVVVPALASEIIANRGPDKREKWYSWATRKLATFPFSGVLGAREIAGALDSESADGPRAPMALSYAKRIFWDVPKRAVTEAKRGRRGKAAAALAEEAGLVLGAPVAQARITLPYLWNVYTGHERPKTFGEFVRRSLYAERKRK